MVLKFYQLSVSLTVCLRYEICHIQISPLLNLYYLKIWLWIFFSDKWARVDYELQNLKHVTSSIKCLVLRLPSVDNAPCYYGSRTSLNGNTSPNQSTILNPKYISFAKPSMDHLDNLTNSIPIKINKIRKTPLEHQSLITDNLNVDRFLSQCIPGTLKTIEPIPSGAIQKKRDLSFLTPLFHRLTPLFHCLTQIGLKTCK